MTLSFMIKRKYLAQKVAEQEETGTFHERRAYKPYWRARIGSVNRYTFVSSYKLGRFDRRAVFLCGRYAFVADILNITIDETPPSIEDVVASKFCYNIECKFLSSELEGLSMFLTDNTGD